MRLDSLHAALLILLALGGCGSSPERVAAENDRLRARAMELENENRTLKGRVSELEVQVARAAATPTSVPEDVAANTPHLVSIELNRLSHARDDDGDARYDTILLYLEPRDGLGRFLQVVGSVTLHAAILPQDSPAQTIGRRDVGPKELRDGYRSAFTGQYYALSLPIDPPAGVSECTLRVMFTDGYSGREFATERVISLQ